MKKLKSILILTILAFSVSVLPILTPNFAYANNVTDKACQDAPESAVCKDAINSEKKTKAFIKTLVNTLLFVLGAVSVIVIIFAGIFYTTSVGDPSLVTKAKNTLLYAVVGVVVALLSFAIVNFVIDTF